VTERPVAHPPPPIDVLALLPEVQEHLLRLLTGLTEDEWGRSTVCSGWSVKVVALHLLGVNLGNLSDRRDQFDDPWWSTASGDTIADLNTWNETWVVAARRISPRLLCELLAFTGDTVSRYYASVDLTATGNSVWWAGSGPSPVWLDVAREYTERWVHQQQIRDAVGKPGLKEPRYLGPVLAAFVHALPRALHAISAPEGTLVRLVVAGEAVGTWVAVRGRDRWMLGEDVGGEADATVTVQQDIARRLWTKGIGVDDAQKLIDAEGNSELAERVLQMVSIMA
jgi:uncharacterized protein (TIGR03083 family)